MGELTCPLILDRIEWNRTLSQRKAMAESTAMPRRWNEVVDRVAQGQVLPSGLATMFARGIHFGWNLMPSIILAAAFRRPLAYLCWGVDYHRGIRRRVARMVLRSADVVFVNDDKTAAEVRKVAGVQARRLPYVVDTEFYAIDAAPRGDFLFCPGANDRDGEVLLALARGGRKVVWLNYIPELAQRYKDLDENLTVVANISFERLRELYRSCAVVVLPLTRDVHAAGQTTALEALASGAAVILSSGRTAELFDEAGLVDVVDGRDVDAWSRGIEKVLARERADPGLGQARAAHIAKIHGPEAVADELIKGLAAIGSRERV